MTSANRPFMSLPNEIRERICGYVLTVDVDDSSPWITPLGNDLRPEPARSSCLAILATCRQILLEAFHVFYKSNNFNFNHPDHLYDFLRAIGSIRANEIRSIRCSFRLAASENTAARYALSKLMRLEKLSFHFDKKKPVDGDSTDWRDYIISRDFCSAKEFAKIHGLREVNFIMMNDTELDRTDKEKMEMYRDRMTKPNPKRNKVMPEIVDLFVGLKMRKHRDPAQARRKQIREEAKAHMEKWMQATRRLQRRQKLEWLWRSGEEARREQDPLNDTYNADQEEDSELTEFLSSEPWIRDAIWG